MRKFIVNAVLFSCVILLFNAMVLLFAENNYYSDYRVFPSDNFRIVLLSDSHGLPLSNHLEKYGVFNFSASSDSYFDMERKLKFLINSEYKIDTVFITVDRHTLGAYRESTNNSDRSNIYTSRKDYNSTYSYIVNRFLVEYFPIFKPKIRDIVFEFIKSYFRNSKNSKSSDWIDLSSIEKSKSIDSRFLSQFGNLTHSHNLINTFYNIINLCKDRGIVLIGIKFPLASQYREKIADIDFNADSILYNNGFDVFDFEDVFNDNEEFFSNQDHLNDFGGIVFSETLINKINY